MQRAILTAAAFLALVPAAHAAARPQAALVSCDRVHRSASFEGRMDARPASARMQMRFILQDREDGRWSRVAVDLGDDGAPRTGAVGALAHGERATVVVGGPACVPGTLLTATADASDVVDEHDEDDDVLSAACPASS